MSTIKGIFGKFSQKIINCIEVFKQSKTDTDLCLTPRLPYEASALIAHLDAKPEEYGVAFVVREAVVHHLSEVGLQGLEGQVLKVLELLPHCCKVHGFLDVFQVVRHVFEADWLSEDVLCKQLFISQINKSLLLCVTLELFPIVIDCCDCEQSDFMYT